MGDLKKVLKDTEKYALHLLLLARIRIPLWNLVTRIQGKEIPTGSCPGPATLPWCPPAPCLCPAQPGSRAGSLSSCEMLTVIKETLAKC